MLDQLDRGRPVAVGVEGEPGIGKTRLLRELTARAEARGHLTLSGAASELEHDVPLSVFRYALDEYLGGLDPQWFGELADDVRTELGYLFPSLTALARQRGVVPPHERYRSYRAIRGLLERLGAGTPLVLVLDDLQWADPASVELAAALLRHPPATAVLIAVALRPRQAPQQLLTTLERAVRDAALTRIELEELSFAEARDLLGETDPLRVAALYEQAGGNPFYLQQLALAVQREEGAGTGAAELSLAIGVPSAVAAALTEELARLSVDARQVIEGAAVAGDPFDPELVAAAAQMNEVATIAAIDELLAVDLIRETDVPRRFRFRHPLVQRAVYETAFAGWRLGAHERCAKALESRGAAISSVAPHVERSAREGDLDAVDVLRRAGEATLWLAPESAVRWLRSALGLLPRTAPTADRAGLLLAYAQALAAAGRFSRSHETLLEAAGIIQDQSSALGTAVATASARVERFLGNYEQAHVRLERSLGAQPTSASTESVALMIELTLNDFYRSRYEAMHAWAARAVRAAKALSSTGPPALLAAAHAMPALSNALTGRIEAALRDREEAAALVDGLSDEELSDRLDAASWLAAAELYLDLYAEADAHATRALALARTTHRDDGFGLYQILPRVWYVRGRLAEAADLLDDAIEAGRLLGTPPALAGNLFNRSAVALALGEIDLAQASANEAFDLTRDLQPGFVTAWAAVRLAAVLLETEQPDRAVTVLLGRAGGDELDLIPGAWRAFGLELLTRGLLALDQSAEADNAAARAQLAAAETGLPLVHAWADRAQAAVALSAGDSAGAIEHALASAAAAERVGAPVEAALSRMLAGRALAQAGSEEAVAQLSSAAAAFDACGALRYRQSAERELARLGRRPYRRTRPDATRGIGIKGLTERELEVAKLVVDRKTNREIAADLFLSQKTVETHLRNIFHKMDVTTRVALARTIERADRTAGPRPS